MSDLHAPVLAWYDEHARDLPWRRPEADAWSVLVSEVMLQQTPVARVLPVHAAWIERWPAPRDLAAAPSGEAVRMWGRLGYPRRALRLHAAAGAIVDRHDGCVPESHEALLALPGVGEYTHTRVKGVYSCSACGGELFRSETKFDSHCGWPSFYTPLAEDRVEYLKDDSLPGPTRVEVRCANCGSHMGHVFEGEGYETPTDQRYCINSISMTLRPAEA